MGLFITGVPSKATMYDRKFCLMANYIQELMSDQGLRMEAKNMGRSLIGVDLFSNELVLVPPKSYQEIVVEPKKKQPKKAEIEEEKENSATPKQVKSTKKSQISAMFMKPAKPEVPRRKIVLDIEENTQRTKTVAKVSAGE